MLLQRQNSKTLRIEVAQAMTTDAYIANGTIGSIWITEVGDTKQSALEKLLQAFEKKTGHKYKRIRVEEGAEHEIQRY